MNRIVLKAMMLVVQNFVPAYVLYLPREMIYAIHNVKRFFQDNIKRYYARRNSFVRLEQIKIRTNI